MYGSLNKVESVAVNMIDNFKSNLVKAAKKAIDDNITDESEIGRVGTTRLYLSEEDYAKIQDELEKLLEKYTFDVGEGKKKYDFFGGIARKIK